MKKALVMGLLLGACGSAFGYAPVYPAPEYGSREWHVQQNQQELERRQQEINDRLDKIERDKKWERSYP
jgi:hypothetical protein